MSTKFLRRENSVNNQSDVSQCQRELAALIPYSTHVSCTEFLDSYWSGEWSRDSDESRHLYNICPKRAETMLEALVTGWFSKTCQLRYADMIVDKLGKYIFGYRKGKSLSGALFAYRHTYIPTVLLYSTFTISEKVYLTAIDDSASSSIPRLVNLWKNEWELLRDSRHHGHGYYFLKLAQRKLMELYSKLTTTKDMVQFKNDFKTQDIAVYFKQGMMKVFQTGEVRVSMPLLEILVVGFILRLVSRGKKIKTFTTNASVLSYVQTFSKMTGIVDPVYLQALTEVISDIVESEFIEEVRESKKVKQLTLIDEAVGD